MPSATTSPFQLHDFDFGFFPYHDSQPQHQHQHVELDEAPCATPPTPTVTASAAGHDPLDLDAMVAIGAMRAPSRSWSWWSFSRTPWYAYYAYPWQVQRQTPKKFFRILLAIFLISLVTLLRLCHTASPHHAPWETPTSSDLVVHGNVVDSLPEPLYPLVPFPDSPMHTPSSLSQTEDGPQPPWLVAVISPATDAARRMLIRSTWMRLYRHVPFAPRFVISNPGPQWMENVRIENRTFGDMIVLDHLQEDDVTANTIKTIELYKWLIKNGQHYEFVSKMDTDLWFNARGFWDRYLSPLLTNETGTPTATVERTIIGELYYSASYDLVFPHGAMYTATWDMVELLAQLQDRYTVVTGEDMAVAMLMLKGHEVGNIINFKGTEKFDYHDGDTRRDGTAWAREKTHPYATRHGIVPEALAVHQLKEENMFLKVADCFDENGVRTKDKGLGPEQTPPFYVLWWDFLEMFKMTYKWESRFERIPEFLWSYENGSWVCDGIWRLGKTREGYLEEHFESEHIS